MINEVFVAFHPTFFLNCEVKTQVEIKYKNPTVLTTNSRN